MRLLVGDVGATKTSLAVVARDRGARELLDEATLPSNEYPSIEDLVEEYLRRWSGPRPTRACFGVAGPVIEGRVRVTNLPWIIDARATAGRLGLAAVDLLNDVEATAYGTLMLDERQKRTILEGEPEPGGTVAIVAPGTGLGKAFLTWDGRRYHAHASEGGHGGYAPSNDLGCELLRALRVEQSHVSWEWVCSGRGIPRLYRFLRDKGVAPESSQVRDEIARAEDPTPAIVKAAFDDKNPCALCLKTVELFASVLGGVAGDMALEVLAKGGVYLAGGMPPRVLPALASEAFISAFREKGPMRELLERVPVHVVLEPRTALIGSAHFGVMRWEFEEAR